MSARRNSPEEKVGGSNVISYNSNVVKPMIGAGTPPSPFPSRADVFRGRQQQLRTFSPDGGTLMRQLSREFDQAATITGDDESRLGMFQCLPSSVFLGLADTSTFPEILQIFASQETNAMLDSRDNKLFQGTADAYSDVIVSPNLKNKLQENVDARSEQEFVRLYEECVSHCGQFSYLKQQFFEHVVVYDRGIAQVEDRLSLMLLHGLNLFVSQERYYKCLISNEVSKHITSLLGQSARLPDLPKFQTNYQMIRNMLQTNTIILNFLVNVGKNAFPVQQIRLRTKLFLSWLNTHSLMAATRTYNPSNEADQTLFAEYQEQNPLIRNCLFDLEELLEVQTVELERVDTVYRAFVSSTPTVQSLIDCYNDQLTAYVGEETSEELDLLKTRHDHFKSSYDTALTGLPSTLKGEPADRELYQSRQATMLSDFQKLHEVNGRVVASSEALKSLLPGDFF